MHKMGDKSVGAGSRLWKFIESDFRFNALLPKGARDRRNGGNFCRYPPIFADTGDSAVYTFTSRAGG